MFFSILQLIFIGFISFIPIVLWAYIFSYNENNIGSKKRFIVGVIGGVLSVFPIIYLGDFLDILNLKYLNVFYYFYNLSNLFDTFLLSFSFFLFLIFIVLFSFLLGFFSHKFKNIIKVYVKNILVFSFFILALSFFGYILNLIFTSFPKLDFSISENIYFGELYFNTFKLIIFYYIIIAFIEEASKHFNFLQSSAGTIDSVKSGVLYAVFVALGFSFAENLLYIYNIYSSEGLSFSLVFTYFFRSIFSVMVHVFCSSLVAYYFTKAYLKYKEKDLSFPYLRIFIFGILAGVFLHLLFDITLTLGFVFIIFFYFIFGYLYVSSIFYKD